ncbi:hypothetical protein GCM10009629_53500 [Pseudonocardia alni]
MEQGLLETLLSDSRFPHLTVAGAPQWRRALSFRGLDQLPLRPGREDPGCGSPASPTAVLR